MPPIADHLSSEGYSFAVGGAVGFACTPVRQYPCAVRLTLDVPHHGAGDAWPPGRASPTWLRRRRSRPQCRAPGSNIMPTQRRTARAASEYVCTISGQPVRSETASACAGAIGGSQSMTRPDFWGGTKNGICSLKLRRWGAEKKATTARAPGSCGVCGLPGYLTVAALGVAIVPSVRRPRELRQSVRPEPLLAHVPRCMRPGAPCLVAGFWCRTLLGWSAFSSVMVGAPCHAEPMRSFALASNGYPASPGCHPSSGASGAFGCCQSPRPH